MRRLGPGGPARTLAAALVVGLALAPRTARADDLSDRQEVAATLLQQLHSVDAVMSMMPAIVAQIRASATHNDPTLLEQFSTIAPKIEGEAESERPALVAALAGLYAQTFTLDELRAMSDFYRTPAGLKMVSSQGQLSGAVLAAAREWGARVARKMAADARAELQGTAP